VIGRRVLLLSPWDLFIPVHKRRRSSSCVGSGRVAAWVLLAVDIAAVR